MAAFEREGGGKEEVMGGLKGGAPTDERTRSDCASLGTVFERGCVETHRLYPEPREGSEIKKPPLRMNSSF